MNLYPFRKIMAVLKRSLQFLFATLFGLQIRHYIKANNEFGIYFKDIICNYNLAKIKLGLITSSLVGENFVLIINNFYEDKSVLYVYRDTKTGKLMSIDCFLYIINEGFKEIRKDLYKEFPVEEIQSYFKELNEHTNIHNPNEMIELFNNGVSEVLINIDNNVYPDILVGKKHMYTIRKSLEYSSKILEGDMKWIKDYKESIWTKDIEKLEWKYKIILNKHIKF